MNREQIATHVLKRLEAEKARIIQAYKETSPTIGYFYIDDVLPKSVATAIYEAFPDAKDTTLKKSMREYKHVAAQMDQYDPLLEEAIYAFQDERIVKFFKDASNLRRRELIY